jgi:hypothetical protein
VFRALAGRAQHDPAIAARLRTDFLEPQRARDRLPLERAVRRGDLPADLDLDAALDRLLGPIYYRVLVTGTPVPPEYLESLVAALLSCP